VERKLMLMVDQRVAQIRYEIMQEQRTRVEQLNGLEQGLQVEFPKLQEQIVTASLERQTTDTDLLKRIQQDSQSLL
jgi:hypothetical protein